MPVADAGRVDDRHAAPKQGKIEVGQRRLDVIQLRTLCKLLGTSLPDFVELLEGRIAAMGKAKG